MNKTRNDTNVFAFLGDSEESLTSKVAKITAYCLLFLVSLTGNALIIWAIYRDKRLRTNTNILVANMAVSDVLCTLVKIPTRITSVIFKEAWTIDGDIGLVSCKCVAFLADICYAVSVYSCIFIAVDRYYAVAHPLKGGFSRSRLKYIIPGIWIFSALICSPNLYSHRLMKEGGFTYCDVDWSQADIPPMFGLRINLYIVMVLMTGIPFLAIAILYSLIVYKLRKHKLPGEPTSNSIRRRREQQNKNVLKMSVTIVGLLFFSWAFVDIFYVLLLLDKLNNDRFTFHFIALFILDLSLTYNFFIYVVFNNIYLQNFRNILSKCLCICSCYRYLKSNCLTKGPSLEENFSRPNAVTSHEHVLILSTITTKD